MLTKWDFFWKKCLLRCFWLKKKFQPGYKVAKDRLTFLLGGNAKGDFKLMYWLLHVLPVINAASNVLKPMLVYSHALNDSDKKFLSG